MIISIKEAVISTHLSLTLGVHSELGAQVHTVGVDLAHVQELQLSTERERS